MNRTIVRIYEIVKALLKSKPKAKPTAKRNLGIKGPYAPPPKPLPKPKPLTPTPLQLKQRQQKNLQAYAHAVQRTLAAKKTPAAQTPTNPEPSNIATQQNQQRSQQEMDDFRSHVRGDPPAKAQF
jgi:hypothetical protein